MEHLYYPSSDGFHTVHAAIWRTEGDVKGILQIVHGMEEYVGRYENFALEAASCGFLVCAEDHLGHGQTAKEGELGHFPLGGEDFILKDIYELNKRAREYAPSVPVFLLGHSMGSFFCREYISEYGKNLSGAVIMGTGYKGRTTLSLALALTKIISARRGQKYKSSMISKLSFGAYNKRFRPARTPYDWLSAEEENVNKYISDGLCGFGFTCGGYRGLFSIISRACSARAFNDAPKDMPLFIVSGAEDPVGGYGKGVKKVYALYKRAGVKDVRLKLYSGARHEILNDFCREEATRDILGFLKECLKSS